jgi:hypothetical protein
MHIRLGFTTVTDERVALYDTAPRTWYLAFGGAFGVKSEQHATWSNMGIYHFSGNREGYHRWRKLLERFPLAHEGRKGLASNDETRLRSFTFPLDMLSLPC